MDSDTTGEYCDRRRYEIAKMQWECRLVHMLLTGNDIYESDTDSSESESQ